MKALVNRIAPWVLLATVVPIHSFGKHHSTAPDPKFLAIEQIVILPVVDARSGDKDKVNLDKYLRETAEKGLRRKNYEVSVSNSDGAVGQIVEEDLSEARPDWIKRLGPPEARWVMVVGISDVHSKTTFGSTGNAEVFGALYDKDSGRVVWDAKGAGRVGQGGLLGIAMKGTMSASAIQTATFNLLSSIPKLPKRRD